MNGVYWTLIKELQFYVLMGVLIYFNVVKYVRVWLSTWLVLTFTFFAFGQPSFLGVIISPEYSPFFMGGITFSLIRNRGLNFFNGLIAVLTAGFACWVTIGNSGPFLHVSISHQVLICQAIVLAFFVVFFMIATRRIRMKAVPTIATLGMITYPLYLLHNYVGKSLMNAALPYFRPEFLVVTMCLIAIVVSCVVYKYLDRPVTKLMKRWLIGPPREHCGVEPRIPEAKS